MDGDRGQLNACRMPHWLNGAHGVAQNKEGLHDQITYR
jgi:hypothetical protein